MTAVAAGHIPKPTALFWCTVGTFDFNWCYLYPSSPLQVLRGSEFGLESESGRPIRSICIIILFALYVIIAGILLYVVSYNSTFHFTAITQLQLPVQVKVLYSSQLTAKLQYSTARFLQLWHGIAQRSIVIVPMLILTRHLYCTVARQSPPFKTGPRE